ncbi:SurA N-terminal domain-containing protein [Hespellia stercorisuis]|uniref:Foldase protein PrsA n=1 Tax=Hespellia stercorisuis DSM 15480 TaxID=1121950 RepID=A0A1M6IKG4_9FIRM|nr:PPIC-type PPIASE domain protein [Hespellia stercorisuis]SHJ34853.1 foldase protein PrsA [Hespellia stercorisuis DSM 15480]
MKRFGKRIAIIGMVSAIAVTSLSGCGKINNKDSVATVGSDEVSMGVANFYARLQQAQYETYYASYMGDDMWTTEVSDGETYEDSVKSSTLEQLEDMYLLKQHAKDYDVSLSEDDKKAIDKAVATFLEDNALEDKELVSGDKKYVKELLELLTYQKKMTEPMQKGVDEEVSDEEAAQKAMQYVTFSYTKTDESGQSSDMTDDEKAAQKKAAQAFYDANKDAGVEEFKAAAEKAGYDLQTQTFDADSTATLGEELVKAADALAEVGDVTKLVETDSADYICQLTSLMDRDATDAKKTEIVQQRKQDQYDSLVKKWRDDTDIKEHKNVWKKVDFVNQGVTMKQEAEEPYAVGSDSSTDTDDEASNDEAAEETTEDAAQ